MNSQLDVNTHRRLVRNAFNRAAHTYDGAAEVQREICESLLGLSRDFPAAPPVERLLDAGCGTGYALPALAHQHRPAQLLALDFAPAMLHRASNAADLLCADIEALPLKNFSMDAVFSSLALQWCHPPAALQSFARVLRHNGMCWIATLGPNTLQELRQSFSRIGSEERIMHFNSDDTWRRAARDAGLEVLALHQRAHHVRAQDLRGVIRHIKAIGAHRPASKPRPPITRREWRQLAEHYEIFRHDGVLHATYDVILMALCRR